MIYFAISILVVALVLAYAIYWFIRNYMGTTQGGMPLQAVDDATLKEEARYNGSGRVSSYSVKISTKAMPALRKAGLFKPPTFDGTAYVACKSANASGMVDAKYAKAVWLPLMPSRGSFALHNDVSSGKVRHIMIAGNIAYVWAIPPKIEVPNTVLLAVADINKATLVDSKCKSLVPVIQPLNASNNATGQIMSTINKGSSNMLNLWAF